MTLLSICKSSSVQIWIPGFLRLDSRSASFLLLVLFPGNLVISKASITLLSTHLGLPDLLLQPSYLTGFMQMCQRHLNYTSLEANSQSFPWSWASYHISQLCHAFPINTATEDINMPLTHCPSISFSDMTRVFLFSVSTVTASSTCHLGFFLIHSSPLFPHSVILPVAIRAVLWTWKYDSYLQVFKLSHFPVDKNTNL